MDEVLHGVGGNRLSWDELPAALRGRIEERLGAAVTAAASQAGGFSPGLASRLRLADGRRVFVKALGGAAGAGSIDFVHREADVMAVLPDGVPAPRMDWRLDADDWTVLAFDDVAGRTPTLPWLPAERDRVLDALTGLAAFRAPAALPAVAEDTALASGWRELAAGDPRLARADPWVRRHIDELADLESRWPVAVAGDALLHGDVRADNVLLTDDRVVFVDWPSATRGVAWFDLMAMLPSLAMQDGGDPATLFDAHPLAAGADPDAVTAALAGIAGYFVTNGLLPVPAALPRIRVFQTAQGRLALDWLRRRLGD